MNRTIALDHRVSAAVAPLLAALLLLLALCLASFFALPSATAFAEDASSVEEQYLPGDPGLDMQELEELGVLEDEELDAQAVSLVRLEGGNRYATMLSIVKQGFSQNRGGAVIVASGKNFPDALAAARDILPALKLNDGSI